MLSLPAQVVGCGGHGADEHRSETEAGDECRPKDVDPVVAVEADLCEVMPDTRVPSAPSAAEVEAVLSGVRQALWSLVFADLSRVSDEEIPDVAVVVEEVARLTEVARGKAAGEVDRRGLDAQHGYTSTGS